MARITGRHAFVLASFCVACSKQPSDSSGAPATTEAREEAPPKKPAALAELPGTNAPSDPQATTTVTAPKAPNAPKPKVVSLLHDKSALWSPWKIPDLTSFPIPSILPSGIPALPPLPTLAGLPTLAWPAPTGTTPPTPAPTTTTSTNPTPIPAPPSTHVPIVFLYGASWCPYCHQAEDHMKARAIAYTYRDVDQQDAAQELSAKLKAAGQDEGGIPVQDVDGTLLVGWSEQAFDQLYDSKNK